MKNLVLNKIARVGMSLFIASFAVTAFAAESVSRGSLTSGLTLLPQVSLNQSSLKGSDIQGTQGGYDIGLLVTKPLSADLSAESGLLYSKAGAKNDAFWVSSEYDLRYLRVPVGVRYTFGESNWYTRGGAYLAYLTSAEQKGQILFIEQTTDISSDTEKLDIGAQIGAGYVHDFGSNFKMNVELNYSRGFSKVFKNNEAHNESVGLAVGFPWAL